MASEHDKILKAIGQVPSPNMRLYALDWETDWIPPERGALPKDVLSVSLVPLKWENGTLVHDPNARGLINQLVWPNRDKTGDVGYVRQVLARKSTEFDYETKQPVRERSLGEFTGLNAKDWRGNALTQREVADQMAEILGQPNVGIIGHNLTFDLGVTNRLFSDFGLGVNLSNTPQYDTLAIERAATGTKDYNRLIDMATRRSLSVPGQFHGSGHDALLSAAGFANQVYPYLSGDYSGGTLAGVQSTQSPTTHESLLNRVRPFSGPIVSHRSPLLNRPTIGRGSTLPPTSSQLPPSGGGPPMPPSDSSYLTSNLGGRSFRLNQSTMTAVDMETRIRQAAQSLVQRGVLSQAEADFDFLWRGSSGAYGSAAEAQAYSSGQAQGAYSVNVMHEGQNVSLELRGGGATGYTRQRGYWANEERAFGIVTGAGGENIIGSYYNVSGKYDPRRPDLGFQPEYQPERYTPEEHMAIALSRAFNAGAQNRNLGGSALDPYTAQRALSDLFIEGSALGERDVAGRKMLPGGALSISGENVGRNEAMRSEYATRLGFIANLPSYVMSNVMTGWMNKWLNTSVPDTENPEVRGVRYEKPDADETTWGGHQVSARGYHLAYGVVGNTGVSAAYARDNDAARLAKIPYSKSKMGPFGATQDIAYPVRMTSTGQIEERPAETISERNRIRGGRIPRGYQWANTTMQSGMMSSPEFVEATFIAPSLFSGAATMSEESFREAGSYANVTGVRKQYDVPITDLRQLTRDIVPVNAEGENLKSRSLLAFPGRGAMRRLVNKSLTVFNMPQLNEGGLWQARDNIRFLDDARRSALMGLTLQLPEYMNENTGEGVYDPSVMRDQEGNLLPEYKRTEDILGADLRKRYGKSVDISYRANAPLSIYADIAQEQPVSYKGGPSTSKTGLIQGESGLALDISKSTSGYSRAISSVMGQNQLRITNLTGDFKSITRAFMSGMAHMPRGQQLDLIRTLLPGKSTAGLEQWMGQARNDETISYEDMAKRFMAEQLLVAQNQQVTNDSILNTISSNENIRGYTGFEFASQLMNSITSASESENALLYKNFGIGRAQGWVSPGLASEGTRLVYQTQARKLAAESMGQDEFNTLLSGTGRGSGGAFVGDWFTGGKSRQGDWEYMSRILPSGIVSQLQGISDTRQRNAAISRVASQIDTTVAQRTAFDPTGTKGIYRIRQNLEGILMPTAHVQRPEYLSTGFRMGYEGMFALANTYPAFARKAGFIPGQDSSINATPSDLGWISTLSAYMYRNEARRDVGFPGGKNVVDITPEMAGDIAAQMQVVDSPRNLLNLQGIVEKVYSQRNNGAALPGNAILRMFRQEEGETLLNEYLPLPSAVHAMDTGDDVSEESRSHKAVMYGNTLQRGMWALSRGGKDLAQGAATSAERFYSGIERDAIGRKTEASRALLGRRIGAGFYGHFQAMPELGLQEVYAGEDVAGIFAQQMGFKGENRVQQFYDWVEQNTGGTTGVPQGRLPSLFMRVPQISRGGGTLPTYLLTPQELERRGIKAPTGPRSRGMIWTNPLVATQQAGDWDVDPLGFLLSASASYDKVSGSWAREIIRDPEMMKALGGTNKEVDTRTEQLLGAMFGSDASKYNVIRGELEEGGLDASMLAGNKSIWSSTVKKISEGRRYDLGQLSLGMEAKSISDQVKGRSYQAMRALESSWSAGAILSQTPEIAGHLANFMVGSAQGAQNTFAGAYPLMQVSNRAVTSLARIYQRGLDMLVGVGEGVSPLESMIGSMKLSYEPGNENTSPASRLTFRTSNELRPSNRDPNVMDRGRAREAWMTTDIMKPAAALKAMATNLPRMEQLSNEAIAYSLANAGDESSFENIFNALEKSGLKGGARGDILTKMVDEGKIGEQSTLWNFMISDTVRKFATSPETKNLVNTAKVPIRGKVMTVAQAMQDPMVALTNLVYAGLTSNMNTVQQMGLTGMAKALTGLAPGKLGPIDSLQRMFGTLADATGLDAERIQQLVTARPPYQFPEEKIDEIHASFYDPSKVNLKVNASAAYFGSMSGGAFPYKFNGENTAVWSPQLAGILTENLLTGMGRGELNARGRVITQWSPAMDRGSELEPEVLEAYNKTFGRNIKPGRAFTPEGERIPGFQLPVGTTLGQVTYNLNPDTYEFSQDRQGMFIGDIKSHAIDRYLDEIKGTPEQKRAHAIRRGREYLAKKEEYQTQAGLYTAGIEYHRANFQALTNESDRRDYIQKVLGEAQFTSMSQTDVEDMLMGTGPLEGALIPGLTIGGKLVEDAEALAPIPVRRMTPEQLNSMATRQIRVVQNAMSGIGKLLSRAKVVNKSEQAQQQVRWAVNAEFSGASGAGSMEELVGVAESVYAKQQALVGGSTGPVPGSVNWIMEQQRLAASAPPPQPPQPPQQPTQGATPPVPPGQQGQPPVPPVSGTPPTAGATPPSGAGPEVYPTYQRNERGEWVQTGQGLGAISTAGRILGGTGEAAPGAPAPTAPTQSPFPWSGPKKEILNKAMDAMNKAAAYADWIQPNEKGVPIYKATLDKAAEMLGMTVDEMSSLGPTDLQQTMHLRARMARVSDEEFARSFMRAVPKSAERFGKVFENVRQAASNYKAGAPENDLLDITTKDIFEGLDEYKQDEATFQQATKEQMALAAVGNMRKAVKTRLGISEPEARNELDRPMSGAEIEGLDRLEDQLTKVEAATSKYNKTLKDHGETSASARQDLMKLNIELKKLDAEKVGRDFVEGLQKELGVKFDTIGEGKSFARRYISWARGEGAAPSELMSAQQEAQLTTEEKEQHRKRAYGMQAALVGIGKEEAEIGVAERAAERSGGFATKIGGMARTLFGGWGLMYMSSIGRLMTEGATTGMQERLAMEQQLGAPFQAVAGGGMPINPMDERQRILASQYGGSGGLLMQQGRNWMMANQQPLYNMAATGLAGISSFGFGAWALNDLLPEGKAIPAAAAIGAGTMIGSTVLNIAGASADVQGSALSIATRELKGQNIWQPNWGAIAGGATTMGTAGFLIGSMFPGAGNLIGAGLGTLTGAAVGFAQDYQKMAAMINPEVMQQARTIEAVSLAGNQGLSIQTVLNQYGISQDQSAYYARMGAAATIQNFPGYSEAALGQVAAQGLKYNAPISDEDKRRLADMLMANENPEAITRQLLGNLGYSIGQMNALTTTTQGGAGIPPYAMNAQRAAPPIETPEKWFDKIKDALTSDNLDSSGKKTSRWPQIQEYMKWTMGIGLNKEEQEEYYRRVVQKQSAGEPSTGIQMAPPGYELAGASPIQTSTSYVMQFQKELAKVYSGDQAGLEAFLQGMQGIGSLGPGIVQAEYGDIMKLTPEQAVKKWGPIAQKFGDMQASGWLPQYAANLQLQYGMKGLGLPYNPIPESAFAGPANPIAQQQMGWKNAWNQQIYSTGTNNAIAMTGLGFNTEAIQQVIGSTGGNYGLLQQQQMQANWGLSQQQRWQAGGMGGAQAQLLGQAMTVMNPQDFAMFSGAMSADPMRLMQLSMQNPSFQMQQLPGLMGTSIPINSLMMAGNTDLRNIGGTMTPTGLPWGTNSLASGAISSQAMAGRIFGGPSQWASQGFSSGAINSLVQGGMRGYQDYTMDLSYQNQMAMIGQQYKQIALQERYQPQFWALEDKSRQLGYQQQEWSFGFQQRQLDASDYWWNKNRGLEKQQITYQREWQKEDWATNQQQRDLQWQWKQEDYAESIRFTTGRQRRIGERQMGRDTIMHNLEQEQADKQQERQKTLWKLEDERFKMSKEQHDQQIDFQQEQIDKQREFFEERKKLEAEQVKLQREYWKDQMQLQKESLGIQAGYAKEMHAAQKTMVQLQRAAEDARGQVNLLTDQSFAGLSSEIATGISLFGQYIEKVQELNQLMAAATGASANGGVTPKGERDDLSATTSTSTQSGGTMTPTSLSTSGSNPWNSTVVTSGSGGSGKVTQTIIVNLGNETLAKYVTKIVDKEILL
jgi:hypothetical protein